MKYLHVLTLISTFALLGGCAGRGEILPNSEKALRRTSAEFAADAAKRFPYKAEAPRGGAAVARAQVGYSVNKVEIVNNGDEDWEDVEVWVNKSYVVWLPRLKARPGKVTAIPFQDFYNSDGHWFPTDNSKTRVNQIEVYHDGMMCDVKMQLAD